MNPLPVSRFRRSSAHGSLLLLLLTLMFAWPCAAAPAQPLPQGRTTPVISTNASIRQALRRFDRYLDVNPQLEQLLDRNLSRINEQTFIEHNPEWANLLQRQPGLGAALRQERNFLLHRILNRHATAALSEKDVVQFDQFLGRHPEINQPVQKNPMQLGNPKFLRAHPPLAHFYDAHPALSTYVLELAGSPNAPSGPVK